MNQCYFVFGAESTGTRLLTRLLIAAGCEGDDGLRQRLDKPAELKKAAGAIVLRRTFPYWGREPNVWELERNMRRDRGQPCEFVYLLIIRDSIITERSQIARKLAKDRDGAKRAIAKSHKGMLFQIFLSSGQRNHRIVTYSLLVSSSAYRRALLADIGLNPDAADAIQFTNEDEKYLKPADGDEISLANSGLKTTT